MKNTVIQGDCLEVMKEIPDKSIDMILTSPLIILVIRTTQAELDTKHTMIICLNMNTRRGKLKYSMSAIEY